MAKPEPNCVEAVIHTQELELRRHSRKGAKSSQTGAHRTILRSLASDHRSSFQLTIRERDFIDNIFWDATVIRVMPAWYCVLILIV